MHLFDLFEDNATEGKILHPNRINLYLNLRKPNAKPIVVGHNIPYKAMDAVIQKIVDKYSNVEADMFEFRPAGSLREDSGENDLFAAYDKILIDLCNGIVKHQKQDSDRYGLVAAAVVDPDHNVVYGINHKLASGKRVHAERAAMANYIKRHGVIPKNSIIITTLSPCTDDMPDRKGPSCTELLNGSPITRVYAGYRDPSQTHLSHDDFDVVYTQNSKIESVCKQIADCFLKESAYTDPANYRGEGVAAFDKPHKTKLNELFTSYGGYELHHNPRNADRGYIYSFNTKDKRDGEIIIKPKHLKQGVDSIVFVEFNIDGSTDTSGKGDAVMIFSTVLKAVNGFAREYKPQYIVFETEDPEKLKLYRRLVKYFVGYKPVDWIKDTVLNRQIGPELSGFAEEAIVLQRQDNADSIKTQSPSQGLYVIYGRGKYAGQVWHRFDLDSTVTPVGRYTREDQAEKFADEWVEKNGKRLGNWNMNYPYDWYLAKDPSGLEFGPAPAGQYSQVSQQDIEYIAWYLSQQQNLDKQGVVEAFDNPYKTKTEKSDYGDVDMLAKLPDGTNLSIMFNNQGDDEWQVEFYRNNSQEVTGEGDAQRVFATVLASMQKFIKKYKPWRLTFSATKLLDPSTYYEPDQPVPNPESRAKLYNRLVQRYATAWGYEEYAEDHGDQITYELTRLKPGMAEGQENFNGIDISMEIQKDDEYVDDEDYDNQVLYVTASSKGKELGHVLFAFDGEYLMPQDLEVEERYRGQGIAQIMYDYVKSKGYKIRRSGQQTDAGAGFWDKHKPGKNIWEQGVAENFANGKDPGRKGLSKRMGVNTKASVSSLRKTARHSTGEKARMAHWLANMKAGRAKKK